MKDLMLLGLLTLLGSCAQAEFSVQSLPSESDVALVDEEGKIKPLGKTPLKVKADDVFKSGSAYSQIQISRPDHHTESIMVSRSSMPIDYEISINLKRQIQDPKALEANSRNERVAQAIAQANNMIATKRLVEAEQMMAKFIQDFPHISVGYDYMGNINYLKKDLKRALYYYEKGLQINPENLETRDMVNKLKSMFN